MLPNTAIRLQSELARCRSGRAEGVLATIVETQGSTYRKTGAMMFVPRFGPPIGLLSGGCLEPEIARAARAAWDEGCVRLIEFDLRQAGEFLVGYGKGCAGRMKIFLEPLHGESPWRAMAATVRPSLRTGVALVYEANAVATVNAGDRIVVDEEGSMTICGRDAALADVLAAKLRSGLASLDTPASFEDFLWLTGQVRVAYFFVEPPVTLRLFGAGVDAEPLAAFGASLGWDVFVYDHRASQLEAARFPLARGLESFDPSRLKLVLGQREAVVVMTHNLLVDAQIVAWATTQPVDRLVYVGLLGPLARRDKVLRWLGEESQIDALAILGTRLHAPIGMDLGGAGEAAIALAVAAEIQRVMHGTTDRSSHEKSSQRGLIGGQAAAERQSANL